MQQNHLNTVSLVCSGNIVDVIHSENGFNYHPTMLVLPGRKYIRTADIDYECVPEHYRLDTGVVRGHLVFYNADSDAERRDDVRPFKCLGDYCVPKDVVHWMREENTLRSDDIARLRRTFTAGRQVINANCSDTRRLRFVTLTYRRDNGPMRDEQRLYRDWSKLRKKLHRRFGEFEYITAVEPQKDGSWHLHVIMIFPERAPYIVKSELEQMWGNGWVQAKSLRNCDNVGAYLSAYLGNVALDADGNETDDSKKAKKYVKGARLAYYPARMRIFRWSRGIKKPVRVQTDESGFASLSRAGVKEQSLVFSHNYAFESEGYCDNMSIEQYNIARFCGAKVLQQEVAHLESLCDTLIRRTRMVRRWENRSVSCREIVGDYFDCEPDDMLYWVDEDGELQDFKYEPDGYFTPEEYALRRELAAGSMSHIREKEEEERQARFESAKQRRKEREKWLEENIYNWRNRIISDYEYNRLMTGPYPESERVKVDGKWVLPEVEFIAPEEARWKNMLNEMIERGNKRSMELFGHPLQDIKLF